MRTRYRWTPLLLATGLALVAPPSKAAASGPTVVKPSSMNGWYFWNDKNDTFAGSPGALVAGPAAPPSGDGSVRLGPLTDNGATAAGHSVIATDAYLGTPLAGFTAMSYATYQPGPVRAIAIQFDVRYRPADSAYGGRLVFEPYQNGAVTVGAGWQSWTPLAGRWWATKTTAAGTGGAQVVALPAGNCAQSSPCTWSQINAAFPSAIVAGRFLLKAGSNWAGFDGNADDLTIGVGGVDATYDFEPETACAATCYADAVGGDDAFGGDTPASAKKTIQAAINAVDAGGQVRVLPGNYHETAPGSAPTTIGGTYQFGLFFGSAKPGIRLIGVTAADVAITDANATLATITTNATNNFGTDGIFVEAADTTIQGVEIGPNDAGDNKTIEVVADNFTLQYAATAIPGGGGSIYIDDFSAGGTVVKSYHILDNDFPDGTSIDVASGAGNTGPVAGREILRNTFDLVNNGFNAISFNGSGGVPWFANPVGGAVIQDNDFKNSAQYIRARGVYAESEFDWASFWNDNTYDRAAVALVTLVPFDVRPYAYSVFSNVRRIGGTIQGEVQEGAVDHAVAGDTVLVKAGTYLENVTVNEDGLAIQGAGIAATVIQGTACGGTGIALTGNRSGIALRDLSVTGFQYGITTGNIGNTVNDIEIEDVSASANCLHGIWFQAGVTTNLALRRVVASSNGGAGGRGFWIINGVKTNVTVEDGTFAGNNLVGIDISDGNVTGLSVTGNTVVGNGDSGIGVLGAQGPGANLVAGNTVTDNGRFGIELKVPGGNGAAAGPGSVVVRGNIVARTSAATDPRDHAGIAVFRRSGSPLNADQPSGVVVAGNTVNGFTRKPIGSTGDGFGIVVEGTNHIVDHNIVTGNDVGVQAQAGNTANGQSTPYFDRGDASSFGGTVHRNHIVGNGVGLRLVGVADAISAECNWWGDASGPGGIGPGTGDTIALAGSAAPNFLPWLLSTDLEGPCSGGTAQGYKQAALAELQSLGPIDKDTDKRIADAIAHLTRSLDPAAWIDADHLDAKKGDHVFDEERETVKKLDSIKNPSAGLAAAIAGWIDDLVTADRLLAATAIAEGGAAKDVAKAGTELAKGDAERAAGKPDQAIDRYRNAWKAMRD